MFPLYLYSAMSVVFWLPLMYISALFCALGTPSEFSSVPILVADELALSFHLCIMIQGKYPIKQPKGLSLDQSPCDCDLAIRVMTTRNIRTCFPKTSNTLEANLATRKGCETEKEYLLGIFHQLRLQQTLHLQFCHITCCIERNIKHEFLIAQWDTLEVAWVNLRTALERLDRTESNQASTSHQ